MATSLEGPASTTVAGGVPVRGDQHSQARSLSFSFGLSAAGMDDGVSRVPHRRSFDPFPAVGRCDRVDRASGERRTTGIRAAQSHPERDATEWAAQV